MDAKKVKYDYKVVEEVVCVAPEGLNKAGKPYTAMKGRTQKDKFLTVILLRSGICRVVIEERTVAK